MPLRDALDDDVNATPYVLHMPVVEDAGPARVDIIDREALFEAMAGIR